MASLNERLAKLEERRAPPPPPWTTPPIVTLLIKEMNAERLELDGRPPDPANEPTLEEREASLEAATWFLEMGGPMMRANSPHSPEALEAILRMEELARQEIEDHATQPTEGASS